MGRHHRRLDESATTHLFVLAHSVPRTRGRAHRHQVSPTLARLIDSWPATPAFVQTHTFLVLAANPLAQALSPAHTPGTNFLRAVFLDPDSFLVEPDPRQDLVACLRGLAGTEADDPDLETLVSELSLRSESFRRLWARHDVRGRTNGRATITHPRGGTLTLDLERLLVPSTPGQQLVVYSAEPDSRTAGHARHCVSSRNWPTEGARLGPVLWRCGSRACWSFWPRCPTLAIRTAYGTPPGCEPAPHRASAAPGASAPHRGAHPVPWRPGSTRLRRSPGIPSGKHLSHCLASG
ncbi:hypothetical protein [Streptomyces sp. NPDC059863]|uniref:MmyB family transcriptional regulator n=1 Tax=unclassified Streptomyces TaxID=2593676 RepID=UPI00365B4F73